jgi:pseudouridine synthase
VSNSDGLRLNKFISDSGFCSRREADAHIQQGEVTVNGDIAGLGTRVMPGDTIKVGWTKIKNSPDDKSDRVYIAYNKPVGITCTTDRDDPNNITDAVRHRARIYPIGRLDNQSEGLIFLTSDGDIVNKILRVGNAHEKEYVVTVNQAISGNFAEKMSSGIPILGTKTKPCKVVVQSPTTFKIILTQGLNRQIRRMCEHLGYKVVKLKRVRIMNVKLGTLKVGQWRNLSEKEMADIHHAVANSDKTESGSGKKKIRPPKNRPKTSSAKRQSNGKTANKERRTSAGTSRKRPSTRSVGRKKPAHRK